MLAPPSLLTAPCRSFLPCRRSFPPPLWNQDSVSLLCKAASSPAGLDWEETCLIWTTGAFLTTSASSLMQDKKDHSEQEVTRSCNEHMSISPIEMGTNSRFGNSCHFVRWLHNWSAAQYPTPSGGCWLRGSTLAPLFHLLRFLPLNGHLPEGMGCETVGQLFGCQRKPAWTDGSCPSLLTKYMYLLCTGKAIGTTNSGSTETQSQSLLGLGWGWGEPNFSMLCYAWKLVRQCYITAKKEIIPPAPNTPINLMVLLFGSLLNNCKLFLLRQRWRTY